MTKSSEEKQHLIYSGKVFDYSDFIAIEISLSGIDHGCLKDGGCVLVVTHPNDDEKLAEREGNFRLFKILKWET